MFQGLYLTLTLSLHIKLSQELKIVYEIKVSTAISDPEKDL